MAEMQKDEDEKYEQVFALYDEQRKAKQAQLLKLKSKAK